MAHMFGAMHNDEQNRKEGSKPFYDYGTGRILRVGDKRSILA